MSRYSLGGESIDGEKQAEGIVELSLNFPAEYIQIIGADWFLLPLRLEEIVSAFEGESAVYLLAGDSKRSFGIEVK